MTDNIVDFDGRRIRPYLDKCIEGFIADPPDSEYQCGFLAALLALYREGLNFWSDDARLIKCEEILQDRGHFGFYSAGKPK